MAVGGIPSWIFQDVALNDGRQQRIVVTHAYHGYPSLIVMGELAQALERLLLAESAGQAGRGSGYDGSRDRLLDQGLHGVHAQLP